LQCKRFDLEAMVRWGTEKKEALFKLDSSEGLKTHVADYGTYIPKDLLLFEENFRRQAPDWESPRRAGW